MNNNLKQTENFRKSSFRLNNQSDPGARTCVSKKADCCVAPAHPPLPFRRNNMSPRLHTQKCKRAPRCHTRHWIYLKTAEMRISGLDTIWKELSKLEQQQATETEQNINTVHAPPLIFRVPMSTLTSNINSVGASSSNVHKVFCDFWGITMWESECAKHFDGGFSHKTSCTHFYRK